MKNNKGLFIKSPNFWRVPRKKKKLIPKDTFYCYKPTSGMKHFDDGTYGYSIKKCQFLKYIKLKDMRPKPEYLSEDGLIKYGDDIVGWCGIVKCEIDDQCKSCGIGYGKQYNK